jgi:hypothetical protein
MDKRWTSRPRGRPSCLSADELYQVKSFIGTRFAEQRPASYTDASEFIAQDLKHVINIDTIRGIVDRMIEFRPVTGVPMEKERVHADPDAITEFYEKFERETRGLPAGLVINLDETGHQEWVDAHNEMVLVPCDFPHDKVPIPIDRSQKRCTLLAGIAADGTCLAPMVVVPMKTIEEEMYTMGCTPDKVRYVHQENGFITGDLFNVYVDEILFPFIQDTRASLRFPGQAVVILDGCTCHDTDFFLDGCTRNGVYPLFLPPHSSDQIQPLDLGIFARQKAEASRIRLPEGLNPQSSQLAKMLMGYLRAATWIPVVSAFGAAGIIGEWNAELRAKIVTINREKAKHVREWGMSKKRIRLDTGE